MSVWLVSVCPSKQNYVVLAKWQKCSFDSMTTSMLGTFISHLLAIKLQKLGCALESLAALCRFLVLIRLVFTDFYFQQKTQDKRKGIVFISLRQGIWETRLK